MALMGEHSWEVTPEIDEDSIIYIDMDKIMGENFEIKGLACKNCNALCKQITNGLCKKCAAKKGFVVINEKPRKQLLCIACGKQFLANAGTVKYCSLVCEAGNSAHCSKCKAVISTNREIATQLCASCYVRKNRKCSRCGNRVSVDGIFEIENQELCGTCVGKHFEKDLKKSKEKEIKKEKRNGKERRIILD